MSGYLHFYAQHPAIALIAEKLNESGNAFHNTADWQDETDYLGGKSACDIVQEALNAADEAFNTLAAAEANDGGTPETDAIERQHGLDWFGLRDERDRYIDSTTRFRDSSRRLERERNGLAARVAELEKDAERLEWLMRNMTGRSLRECVGELADTGDIAEFRAAIDAARSKP